VTTPILKIPEAADGQVNQYLVLNEGLRALESSGNEFYEVDLSAGNVTLTDVSPGYIFSRNFMFKTTGNAVARILTVPATKRLFAVQNGGSAELTVKCGATEIGVPAAGSFMFYGDGTTDGLFAIAGGAGGASADTFDTAGVTAGAVDLTDYNAVWIVELDDDVTAITLPSAPAGQVLSLLIMFTQDIAGGHTVTGWPGGAIFESGSEPVISATGESITSVPVLILGSGDIYVVG
jgi:hypothetical protein